MSEADLFDERIELMSLTEDIKLLEELNKQSPDIKYREEIIKKSTRLMELEENFNEKKLTLDNKEYKVSHNRIMNTIKSDFQEAGDLTDQEMYKKAREYNKKYTIWSDTSKTLEELNNQLLLDEKMKNKIDSFIGLVQADIDGSQYSISGKSFLEVMADPDNEKVRLEAELVNQAIQNKRALAEKEEEKSRALAEKEEEKSRALAVSEAMAAKVLSLKNEELKKANKKRRMTEWVYRDRDDKGGGGGEEGGDAITFGDFGDDKGGGGGEEGGGDEEGGGGKGSFSWGDEPEEDEGGDGGGVAAPPPNIIFGTGYNQRLYYQDPNTKEWKEWLDLDDESNFDKVSYFQTKGGKWIPIAE